MHHNKKKLPVKEYKDGRLQKLKKRLSRLEKENEQLKSQLRAYDSAFRDITRFLRDSTKDISLEELIDAASKNKSLKQVKDENTTACKKCLSEEVVVKPLPFGRMISCPTCGEVEIVKNVSEQEEET